MSTRSRLRRLEKLAAERLDGPVTTFAAWCRREGCDPTTYAAYERWFAVCFEREGGSARLPPSLSGEEGVHVLAVWLGGADDDGKPAYLTGKPAAE